MNSGISEDLPFYLKSKFSVTNPPCSPKRPLKCVKPMLMLGVSSDSPTFFHSKHVGVLNNAVRNKEISGADLHPERFLSELKKNRLSIKPKFNYADDQYSDLDYHSLKPSTIIDLAADKSPKIKEQTKFRQEFRTYLQKGFGKARGQCTFEAMQPKVPRYMLGQMEFLKTKVNFTMKIDSRLKGPAAKSVMNQTLINLPSVSNVKKSHSNQRNISTPLNLADLDKFDKMERREFSPIEARMMYSLDEYK